MFRQLSSSPRARRAATRRTRLDHVVDAAGEELADETNVVAADAVELALGALRYRDLSEEELARKLEARGVAGEERAEAVETLRRTGLLDDLRFAQGKGAALASRGASDALIRESLRRAGVAADVLEQVVQELEPEAERARAVVARRGASPRTARYLAAKGFSSETIQGVIASESHDALG